MQPAMAWPILRPVGAIYDDVMNIAFIVISCVISFADGTCNKDQYQSCRNAARSGDVGSLEGGGYCLAKPYIQFTHVCIVNNYTPHIDFCCCIIHHHHLQQHHQQQQQPEEDGEQLRLAACCRYHHDWNYFRCAEVDDVVDITLPALKTLTGEWLAAAILLPIVVAIGCVYCVVKCCCYRYDGDSEIWCCQSRKSSSWKSSSPMKGNRAAAAEEEEDGYEEYEEEEEEAANVVYSEEDLGTEDERLSLSLSFQHSSASAVYGRHFCWRPGSGSGSGSGRRPCTSSSSSCVVHRSPYDALHPVWRQSGPSSEEWLLMRCVPPTAAGPDRCCTVHPPPPLQGPPISYQRVPSHHYHPAADVDLLDACPGSSVDYTNYPDPMTYRGRRPRCCCHLATAPLDAQRVAPPRTDHVPYERRFYHAHAPPYSPATMASCPTAAHACQCSARVPVLTNQPRFRTTTSGLLLPSVDGRVTSYPVMTTTTQTMPLAAAVDDGGRAALRAEQPPREEDEKDERTQEEKDREKEEEDMEKEKRQMTMKREEDGESGDEAEEEEEARLKEKPG